MRVPERLRSLFAVLALCVSPTFWLSGCASRPCPPPAITAKVITVEKPVPVSCVAASDIPAIPPKVHDDFNGDAVHDLDITGASAILLRTTLEQAVALLGACVK